MPPFPSTPKSRSESSRGSAAPSREKLSPARMSALRDLVEGTSRSYRRIGVELGLSPATISRYVRQEGWRRPPGAAVPARIGTQRERVTRKLWDLTERHTEALEDQPIELAQRSLQPLARLTRMLGDIEKHSRRSCPPESPLPLPEAPDGRSVRALRDELASHLARIVREEDEARALTAGRFEDGGGI